MRWRIIHYINLNNKCKVVSSQTVSLNAGQESSLQHGLLPFPRQSCGTVLAGRVPFASVTTARCWQCSRSSQSMKIDKSIKIGKSDLIDIDCIDQLVEIDDTLVLLIDLSWFLPISSISYWKIHLFICSSKNENWLPATAANLLRIELTLSVEVSNIYHF